jgi:hypothetical protein
MRKASSQKNQGKFWPDVRVLIWEKAQELYQQDESRGMSNDFTGTTATKKELREGGYFNQAKIIVLRELLLQRKGASSASVEERLAGAASDFPPDK